MGSPPDPLVGKTLEKVRLLHKIGSGGMSSVYLAEHLVLGKKVAVKILPPHLSTDPEYVARFRREAETASRLQHPNIVEIHDIGSDGERYFIVMQWIDGESLQAAIDALGRLDPRDAAKAAIGILKGLHHAHQAGIIHRDIKPDNVLITRENEPKILDFGLAIETDETQKLTAAGTVVGTPFFISPEQARGHKAEIRSDIYSLGVTLYNMVTGRVPYAGQNALAVLNRHIKETPVPPAELVPKLPPLLNDIILRMMAKRPQDRYLTADLARRDLEAFLEGKPVVVAKPAAAPRSSSRRPVLWGALAGGFAAVILTLVAIRGGDRPPVDPPSVRPVVSKPPAEDPLKADREALEALVRKAGEEFGDHASFPGTLAEFDAIAARHPHDALYDAVKEATGRYRARLDELGETEFAKLRPRLDAAAGSPFLQIGILGEFPRGLLKLSGRGAEVERRREELRSKLPEFVAEEFTRIEGWIKDQIFDRADASLLELAIHAPVEDQPRVRALRKRLDERESAAIAAAEAKLQSALKILEPKVDEAIVNRSTTAAWRAVIAFLQARAPGTLEGRILRVELGLLAGVSPEQAADAEIDHWVAETGRIASEPGSECRARVGLLLEDVLKIEWLLRRAAKGIERLDGATVEIGGAKGRVRAGPPASFVPEGQAARALVPRMLPPGDLFLLAAAADYGTVSPVDRAWADSKALVLASAVDRLRWRAPDRHQSARRWFAQAVAIKGSVPSFRIDDITREAAFELERLIRQFFEEANQLALAKKWAEVYPAMDRAEARAKAAGLWATLEPEARTYRAGFLLREARACLEAKSWARAKEIVARLRAEFEADLDPGEVDRVAWDLFYRCAPWVGGHIPENQTFFRRSPLWGWDGKAQESEPPAKIEAGPSLRIDRNRRLVLNEERTPGVTGMQAKFRLNEERQVWNYGFLFDITTRGMEQRLIRVTSEGKVEYATVSDRRITVRETKDLPAEVKVGAWHELAWVSQGGEVIIYVDGTALLSVPVVLEDRHGLGLQAEGDVSVKELKLRDYRGG